MVGFTQLLRDEHVALGEWRDLIRTGLQGTERHRKTAASRREKEQFSLEEISAGSAVLNLTNSTSSAAEIKS